MGGRSRRTCPVESLAERKTQSVLFLLGAYALSLTSCLLIVHKPLDVTKTVLHNVNFACANNSA